MRRITLAITLIVSTSLIGTAARASASGDSDLSFGDGGRSEELSGFATPGANVEVYPDGRLVTGGRWWGKPAYQTYVARYLPDGTVDRSFGGAGYVTQAPYSMFGGRSYRHPILAPQMHEGDAKLLVTDYTSMLRYNEDGTLDITFADGGTSYPPLAAAHTWTSDIEVSPNGERIVDLRRPGSPLPQPLVVYTSDGRPDPTFADDGVAHVGAPVAGVRFSDAALQPDGKIVLGGRWRGGRLLTRILPSGEVDTSFGMNGYTLELDDSPTGSYYAPRVEMDPEGNILAFVPLEGVRRYRADGTSDTTFGNGGVASLPRVEMDSVFDWAVDHTGRIIFFGTRRASGESRILLIRMTPGGYLDHSFGANGVVVSARTYYDHGVAGGTVQATGNPVVAATAYGEPGLYLWRFLAGEDTSPPPSSITLVGSGSKEKGMNVATLSWTGASGPVDVWRDASLIAIDESDSPYSDYTGTRGQASFTYTVCIAGSTSDCSNEVRVTF